MPPVPPLPRTWSPRFVRVTVTVVGTLLVVACLGMWFALPAAERALFSGAQAATLAGFLLALVVGLYGLARTEARADEGGLTIVNVFRTRRLSWPQIVRVVFRPGDPWVYLDVDDGSTVAVMGIQSADGQRGRTAVRELRAVVSSRTSPEAG